MTDAEYNAQRARVAALIDRWVDPLGVALVWSLRFRYQRAADEKSPRCAFKCTTEWRYRRAVIDCYLPELVDLDDDDLEFGFVHDLCHTFFGFFGTTPRQPSDYADHEEHAVSQLAWSFIRLREHLTSAAGA